MLLLTGCDHANGLPDPHGGNQQVRYVFSAGETATGSTAASMRAHITGRIQGLAEDDRFDAAVYGDQYPAAQAHIKAMWGSSQPATGGNKQSGVSWINGPSTNPLAITGDVPYLAWQRLFQTSPPGTTLVFVINDIGASGNDLIRDLPAWRALYPGLRVELRVFNPNPATEMFATQAQSILDDVVIQ
jgi:hypothetical protein